MKIDNAFLVDLPVEQAWGLLNDIPSLVPCMPGAALIAVEDDRTWRGQVTVKLGPVTVTFQGRARIEDIDATARTVRVKASGNETKGRGSAQAEVHFAMQPDGAGTRVKIITDLALAGAVAQYGRAQGVIADVAQVVIDTFARNLRDKIAASAAAAETALASAAAPDNLTTHSERAASTLPPRARARGGEGGSRASAREPGGGSGGESQKEPPPPTPPHTRKGARGRGVDALSSGKDSERYPPAPTAPAPPAAALSAWSVLVAVVRRWLSRNAVPR